MEELQELRNRVAAKKQKEKEDKEKKELQEELERGTVRGIIKKGFKKFIS